MSAPRIFILVESPQVRELLEELARELPWAASHGVCFQTITGDTQQVVATHRARDGSVPIGVVADSESNALAALVGGADEASVLSNPDATALTAFVDRVELRARLRAEHHRMHESFAHAEKLTALGTLIAGIGHEINNPLSVMLLSVDTARRYLLPAYELTWEMARNVQRNEPIAPATLDKLGRIPRPYNAAELDVAGMFDDIGHAGDSIASIVRDLRVFSRTDHEEPPELVSVEELIDQALRLVGRELFQHALLERDYATNLPKLVVPRNRVVQVIINILINAAHAIREIERPTHRIRISARADAEFVAVSISDTGPGIPPETVDRIFDPFFTTKRKELGTGLGLSLSRTIVRRMGGDLSVESIYGDGATFLCFLPVPARKIVDAVSQRPDTIYRHPTLPAGMRSVLVVDDDERVLRSYQRLLNPKHRVLIAQDGRDAIDLLESGSTPDALLLELDLPGADGRALLGWLAQHRPILHQHSLIVTSAASHAQYEEFLRNYDGPILHKPVHGNDLLTQIDHMLG